MSENDHSGNRWESETGHARDEASGKDAATDTPLASGPALDEPSADAAAPARTRARPAWLTRSRTIVGGVAAATFVIGGAFGFGIGHATTGDSDGGRQPGLERGFDGGFEPDEDGPGGGFGHDGQQPPSFQDQNGQPGSQSGDQSDPGTSS